MTTFMELLGAATRLGLTRQSTAGEGMHRFVSPSCVKSSAWAIGWRSVVRGALTSWIADRKRAVMRLRPQGCPLTSSTEEMEWNNWWRESRPKPSGSKTNPIHFSQEIGCRFPRNVAQMDYLNSPKWTVNFLREMDYDCSQRWTATCLRVVLLWTTIFFCLSNFFWWGRSFFRFTYFV